MKRQATLVALAGMSLSSLCVPAQAQTRSFSVSPPIQVNLLLDPAVKYGETAIAASARFAGQFVAATIRYTTTGSDTFRGDIVYAESLDGAITFPIRSAVLDPGCLSGGVQLTDPFCAASQNPSTGDVYVGQSDFADGSSIVRLAGGSSTPGSPVGAICGSGDIVDLASLAIGPTTDGASEIAYLPFIRQHCSGSFPTYDSLRYRRQISPATTSPAWSNAQSEIGTHFVSTNDQLDCDNYKGDGNRFVVVPSGGARGWVIASWAPVAVFNGQILEGDTMGAVSFCRNPDGLSGTPSFSLSYSFTGYGSPSNPTPIHRYQGPGPRCVAPIPGIAIDPTNPNIVYVVFCGVSDIASPTDSDIFVARGVIDPQAGTVTFSPEQTLRLSDAIMEPPLTPETDQLAPNICVDMLGGLNLIYVRHQGPDVAANPFIDIYYARIPDFATTLATGAGVEVARLSPTTFDPRGDPNFNFYGDYLGITTSGCFVYPCYTGRWDNGSGDNML